MPDSRGGLRTEGPAADDLHLLDELGSVDLALVLVLLEHPDVVGSLAEDGALRALRDDHAPARQQAAKLVDLGRDTETSLLLALVALLPPLGAAELGLLHGRACTGNGGS